MVRIASKLNFKLNQKVLIFLSGTPFSEAVAETSTRGTMVAVVATCQAMWAAVMRTRPIRSYAATCATVLPSSANPNLIVATRVSMV